MDEQSKDDGIQILRQGESAIQWKEWIDTITSQLKSKPVNERNELRFTPTRANSDGRTMEGKMVGMKDATREKSDDDSPKGLDESYWMSLTEGEALSIYLEKKIIINQRIREN